ncbi:Mitogen-activated protein kinase kinase kinase kinase 5 [Schistosoma japonicum]|nr:Mitogen-activated protein kinase kinase kinase kinase 5 [Schistosoma japonicum]
MAKRSVWYLRCKSQRWSLLKMAVRSELSEQKLGYIREFVNNKDPKEEYKLIQSIGTGTYGEVYKAIRLRTKEFAAVKIIKVDAKDDVRTILQEIQTLRECRHCNIVQFFGSYFRNNKLWICMEFCGGFSMQDIYTNIQRPIEENCIAFVSRETLRGIEYMHKAGKIHRDIKGANILLTNDGDVKIADFGVAAQITQTIQRRNSFIGTPYWMAPEVAAVERKGGYDEKCDVWALGITAIEYAELQPPLFDLHPMRALRILGMRSYKPPVLRNKSLWSQKFHNFLKSSLIKSEKKRPTAQALLRHEFVNQPHLTRLLTLKLLETNRNPNVGNNNNSCVPPVCGSEQKPNALRLPEGQHQEYSALLAGRPDYPMVMNKLPLQSPIEEYKDRTLVQSEKAPYSSPNQLTEIQLSSGVERPISSTPSNRPEPVRKMHTPWQSQVKSDQISPITNVPKPITATIAEVIVQKSLISPMEHIQSARPQQFLIEHSVINGSDSTLLNKFYKNGSHHPSNSRSVLEEIRIMDELPTPFPAYVASAPTAMPALKPPGLNYNKVNNYSSVSPITTSKHIEDSVQNTSLSSFSDISQSLHTNSTFDFSSTTVVTQKRHRSSSNSSSSISSASTSPRSPCSSSQLDLLDPVSTTDVTSESHQTTILSASNASSSTSPDSATSSLSSSTSSSVSAGAAAADNEENSNEHKAVDESMSTSNVERKSAIAVDEVDDDDNEVFLTNSVDVKGVNEIQQESKNDIEFNNHEDYLAITEHTIIQDSLEAQFLPIDCEPHVVETHSIQVTHHSVNPQNGEQLCRASSTIIENVVFSTTTSTTPNATSVHLESNESINSANQSSHNIPKSISIDDYSTEDNLQLTKGIKHRNDEQQCKHQHLPLDEFMNGGSDGEDDLNDIFHYAPERISPLSFDDRGTVTTIESHLSSIMVQEENDGSCDIHNNINSNEFDYSSTSKEIDVKSERFSKSPPHAHLDMHSDNPDEWDLDVADRELLAADGLLYLDRSHAESLSDRISEFGFRIHGSSDGEEDLEDDYDDADDSGIRDEIIIPNDLSAMNMMNLCQLSSNAGIDVSGVSPTLSRINQMNINGDSTDIMSSQKLSISTTEETNHIQLMTVNQMNHATDNDNGGLSNMNAKCNSTMTNSTININNNHCTFISQKELDLNDIVNSTGHEFYPEKSGEELMSLLRQLKFAQKFAWLSGASVLPTTLSTLANFHPAKLNTTPTTNTYNNQSLTNGIFNDTIHEVNLPTTQDRDDNINQMEKDNKRDDNYRKSLEEVAFMRHHYVVDDTSTLLNRNNSSPNSGINKVKEKIDTSNNEIDKQKQNEQVFNTSEFASNDQTQELGDRNSKSLPPTTISAYFTGVLATKCTTTTAATITPCSIADKELSKINIVKTPRATSPVSNTTTSPSADVLMKSTPISIADDIHLIDVDIDNDVDGSNIFHEDKPHIGGSLQLIPQMKNKKRSFYRSSLSPCVNIHSFPSSISLNKSLVTVSSSKLDAQMTHNKQGHIVSSSNIPQSNIEASPIITSEYMRTTASISCLPSPQLVASQPHLKIVSSIKLSADLLGDINNRPLNGNFSENLPLVSSVKLQRRTGAFAITNNYEIEPVVITSTVDCSANKTTSNAVLSKISTSPALISSVIIPVNKNETEKSRSSMIELISSPNKDAVSCLGVIVSPIAPPLPSPISQPSFSKPPGNMMGARFSLVFEGCPLKINSTATWINPVNNGQVILFGTNDGIYCLQLKGLSENSLELLFPRRCLWLSVTRDTMMSLSGRHPQLYAHNLVSLMKLKSHGHSVNGSSGTSIGGGGGITNFSAASKFGKFVKLFPKRFSPSKKLPDTKGCRCANVTRNPFNGAKYLCAAMTNEILVMEWFNPISSFIEIKRIFVPDMPSPLLNFDLLIVKNLPLPLACLGVYRHHSRKGREGQRFRLHLIDLNSSGPNLPQMPPVTSSVPLSISLSPVTSAPSAITATTTATCVSPSYSCLVADSSLSPQSVISQAEHICGPNESVDLSNNKLTYKTHAIGKSDQTKAELQRKNTIFLSEDILPVVETVQLEHNTILICFQDCAKVVSLNGQIKSSRHRATTLDFNGITIESVVCFRDSILAFHPHGLLGKSFTGEVSLLFTFWFSMEILF